MTGKFTDKFCSNEDDRNYGDSETSVAEQSAINFLFPTQFYKVCANPDHWNMFASMQVLPENARIARQRKSMGCAKYFFQLSSKMCTAFMSEM